MLQVVEQHLTPIPPTGHELRAARLANVLARAVRDGEVASADALRVIRHELRRRNTNKKLLIETRSRRAQAVIDQYGAASVPKNGSSDALHADHVYPLTTETLHRTDTVEKWIAELDTIQMVVCVTAEENYRLLMIEKAGVTGPDKYAKAAVEFITEDLPWRSGD